MSKIPFCWCSNEGIRTPRSPSDIPGAGKISTPRNKRHKNSITDDILQQHFKGSLQSEEALKLSIFLELLQEMMHPADVTRNVSNFTFSIGSRTIKIKITTITGSLLTQVWNKFARCDDEYTLEYAIVDDFNDRFTPSHFAKLWRISGYDSYNEKLVDWDVNWYLIKELQVHLGFQCLSHSTFIRYFSLLMTSLSAISILGRSIVPMPSTLMINYLFERVSAPCCIVAQQDSSVDIQFKSDSQRIVLSKLLQEGGDGVWLPSSVIVSAPHAACMAAGSTHVLLLIPISQRSDPNATNISSSSQKEESASKSVDTFFALKPSFSLTTGSCLRSRALHIEDSQQMDVRLVIEEVYFKDSNQNRKYFVEDVESLIRYTSDFGRPSSSSGCSSSESFMVIPVKLLSTQQVTLSTAATSVMEKCSTIYSPEPAESIESPESFQPIRLGTLNVHPQELIACTGLKACNLICASDTSYVRSSNSDVSTPEDFDSIPSQKSIKVSSSSEMQSRKFSPFCNVISASQSTNSPGVGVGDCNCVVIEQMDTVSSVKENL